MERRLRLRDIFFYLILIIITVFLIINFNQLQKFSALLAGLNIFILSLILIVRFFSYWANTRYFESFFKLFDGNKIGFKRLFITTIVMNFINTILPSGGISGTSYLIKATEPEVKASTATIAQISWYVLTFLAYLIILVFGFISLFLSNQIGKISFRIILIIITFMIISAFVGITIVLNKKLTKNIGYLAIKPFNFVLKRLKKSPITTKDVNRFIDDFYNNASFLLKNINKLKWPFFYCLIGVIFEILSIYIVFLSFGKFINPGVVVAGYTLAMASSLASLLTSGVGVYEAAMVATFVGLGQTFALSLSVVLVYRVIAFWLFIPVGLFFYKRQIDENIDR